MAVGMRKSQGMQRMPPFVHIRRALNHEAVQGSSQSLGHDGLLGLKGPVILYGSQQEF